MRRLLLIEDDEVFGQLLKNYLEISNFNVEWAKDGAKGLSKIKTDTFDLCILDVMMPHLDGFSLGTELSQLKIKTPFIYLTARGEKNDILKGYSLGAKEYLVKPFDVEILIIKINLLLNQEPKKVQEEYEIGSFKFNAVSRVLSGKEEKRLSPKEGALLLMLVEKQGQLLERKTALEHIWKEDSYFTKRSMDVYITKLRKYLADDVSVQIETIPSSGFVLQVNSKV